MRARTSPSCDHAVRPCCVRGVDGEDIAKQKSEGAREQEEVPEQGGRMEEVELCGLGEEELDEEQEAGKRGIRKLHDPKLPKEDEVKEHYLSGHMPYRSWCPHCVKGRGKEMDHKKGEDEQGGIPEYHMDHCFPGDEHVEHGIGDH